MKICCQLPIAMPRERFGGYYDLLMRDYTLHKNDDTEIVIKDVGTGISNPALLGYHAFRAANDLQIAKSMVAAGKDGADAVAGAAYLECGSLIAALKTAEMLASLHRAGMKIKPDIGLFGHPGDKMLQAGMGELKSMAAAEKKESIHD